MLKGKNYKILEFLDMLIIGRGIGDAFADDKLETTEVICWTPVALGQKFLLEEGKPESLFMGTIFDNVG
jgi:hypothetical protein